MAKIPSILLLSITTAALLSASGSTGRPIISSAVPASEEDTFTKLHFYMHDFVSGPNQSVYNVAESSITPNSASFFGRVQVIDHILTSGPELDSEKVGRVQGVHALSDLNVAAISVNWNFLFNDGSTISVLGRLVAFAREGELTIVGGTGKYMMATGYAMKKTVAMEPEMFLTIFEYTLYVYSVTSLLGIAGME